MERKTVGAHRSLASSMSAGCIAKNRCFGRSTAVTLWLRLTCERPFVRAVRWEWQSAQMWVQIFAQCRGKVQRQSAEARVNAQQSGSREYGNLVRHTREQLSPAQKTRPSRRCSAP